MPIPTPAVEIQTPIVKSSSRPGFGPVDMARLVHTRTVYNLHWSADGRQVYFETNITGRVNIWCIAATGGWPTQLTIEDERTALQQPSPDGKWLLYTQDVGGNEKPNIYRLPASGGPALKLTHTERVSYWSIRWSPDGRRIGFAAELEAPGVYRAYAITPDGENRTLLADETGGMVQRLEWSPEGKRLALERTHDFEHTGIFLRDLTSGEEQELIPIREEARTDLVAWSPDGTSLLVNDNDSPTGMMAPAIVDVRSGTRRWLRESAWEVEAFAWSPNGRYIAYAENVAGNHTLYRHDVATGEARAVSLPPGWVWQARFSPDSTRLAVLFTSADHPSDIWVVDLTDLSICQVTDSFVGGLRPDMFVQPQVVTYPSFDGTPIAALLYMPPNLARDGSHPAIVHVHGGPTWQSVNRWHREIAYLVTHGYIVIAPNYRGSTGFGRAFEEANRRDLGGGDLRDVVAAVDFLKGTGYVNPDRVVVMGASYGGYMTLMALTKVPDRWAAGVAVVPFANWFTEYENEDEVLKAYDRMMMGDPEENADLWRDRSPIFFVDNIRAPLLLLAGANDIRCPAEETEQIAEAVRRKGIPVEVKIYPDEGHGFMRRENQVDAMERVVHFLEKVVPTR